LLVFHRSLNRKSCVRGYFFANKVKCILVSHSSIYLIDSTGKRKIESNGDGESGGSNICTSWDDDPVLLDVIGKEALVYIPSKEVILKCICYC